ncbi:MAG: hypothetical protein ABR577_03805 [Pyrinomonadaceae bacterium]
MDTVAATIRQLYEMIEVEDERVHKLVARAASAHLQKIEQLTNRIAKLEEELSNRARQVHRLTLTVKELNKQLKAARQQTQLAKEAHLAHLMKSSPQLQSAPFDRPSQKGEKLTREEREEGRRPTRSSGHDIGFY